MGNKVQTPHYVQKFLISVEANISLQQSDSAESNGSQYVLELNSLFCVCFCAKLDCSDSDKGGISY